ILAHRIVWTLVLCAGVLLVRRDLAWSRQLVARPRLAVGVTIAALLIAANWVVYVAAVLSGRTTEAALGYFLNPIVTVALGVLVLRERLRPLQWVAVALAAPGVLWLALRADEVPWIALILATSFAAYGLIRKQIAVEAVVGLAAETTLIAPFALGYLLWNHVARDTFTTSWLALGGFVTAVPLALFAHGARLIPLATVGLIQYLAPSLQFATGVLVFGEPFTGARAIGFVIIWTALALYAAEGLLRHALNRPRSGPGPETTPR
ncbi:MAG TPA: EamA family transporter RarD, partial [Polyangiales bacterium]|nr:EamA family transporter RarD [Polyangiales bacterium]